jgi:hypothetical protein
MILPGFSDAKNKSCMVCIRASLVDLEKVEPNFMIIQMILEMLIEKLANKLLGYFSQSIGNSNWSNIILN